MTRDFYAVIMAGGEGTRLWPLSRRERPKQMLDLLGDRTLFQMAVDRVEPTIPAERIYVVTVAEQAGALREQSPQIPEANFLIEPSPKGTASVIGLAAVHLRRRDPEAVMACLTADHYIANVDKFRELLLVAREVALGGGLVTLGITPTYPATGYGYIQKGQGTHVVGGYTVHPVAAFKEKPDLATASRYLASGDHTWNSGMFIWRASRILEELKRRMEELYRGLTEIEDSLETSSYTGRLAGIWAGLQRQTIDYGVMEHAQGVTVIPADELGWWDVGEWGRLFEVMTPDGDGNLVLVDESVVLDSHGNLLYREKGDRPGRMLALLGVNNLVVVDAGDVILVCSRERAHEVRGLVQELERRGLERYL